MAKVSVYLNFASQTEEAFNFYKTVFGGEFVAPGIRRFGDMPPMEGLPPLPDHLRNGVMHVELPIMGDFVLMGTDSPVEMGFNVNVGNNMYINLHLDTKEETQRLFVALSDGGKIEQQLDIMFWGAYFGSCEDKFGVRWMFNCDK
ncbi:MAG TPA: VOC family protein [Saprospiraceae bacterium]|nr:VOC family protein [Saprospiraceae bacterium]HMU03591.1 VOC family protein [Saprospiraceae bacterium]